MGSSWEFREMERILPHPWIWCQPWGWWKFHAGRKPPHRRHRKGFAAKKIVFFCGCVLFARMGTLFHGVLETLVSPAKVWMPFLVGKGEGERSRAAGRFRPLWPFVWLVQQGEAVTRCLEGVMWHNKLWLAACVVNKVLAPSSREKEWSWEDYSPLGLWWGFLVVSPC